MEEVADPDEIRGCLFAFTILQSSKIWAAIYSHIEIDILEGVNTNTVVDTA